MPRCAMRLDCAACQPNSPAPRTTPDAKPAFRQDDPVQPTPPSPPPPLPGGSGNGFDTNRPTIISLCYLASFITGISGIVGLILAYIWQGETGASETGAGESAWERSHLTYLIRTFWIGLLYAVISLVLTVIVIGVFGLIATAIWTAVRSVLSLVRAQKREPMPDPGTWWV